MCVVSAWGTVTQRERRNSRENESVMVGERDRRGMSYIHIVETRVARKRQGVNGRTRRWSAWRESERETDREIQRQRQRAEERVGPRYGN